MWQWLNLFVKQIKVCMFKRRQGVAVLEAHTHMIYKDKDMVCVYIYIYIYMREWEVSIKTDVWVLLQNTGVNMKRSTWKWPRGKHENQHGLNIKLTTGNKGYMWRVTTHNETHTHSRQCAATSLSRNNTQGSLQCVHYATHNTYETHNNNITVSKLKGKSF